MEHTVSRLARIAGVPLQRIREIIDQPTFDGAALMHHRALLEERGRRTARLMETIDRSLARLRGEGQMLGRFAS